MAGLFKFSVTTSLDTKGLDRITAGIPKRVRDVLRLTAFKIEGRAKEKERPFIDTGNLVGSIRPDFKELRQFKARVGASAEYAPFIEFGTRHFQGRFFLTKSLEEESGDFVAAISQVLRG